MTTQWPSISSISRLERAWKSPNAPDQFLATPTKARTDLRLRFWRAVRDMDQAQSVIVSGLLRATGEKTLDGASTRITQAVQRNAELQAEKARLTGQLARLVGV